MCWCSPPSRTTSLLCINSLKCVHHRGSGFLAVAFSHLYFVLKKILLVGNTYMLLSTRWDYSLIWPTQGLNYKFTTSSACLWQNRDIPQSETCILYWPLNLFSSVVQTRFLKFPPPFFFALMV